MGANDNKSSTITTMFAKLLGIPRQLWRDLLSVYYTNTPVWRWLKSGTLVFFGFFLWVSGALLYAFQPEWGWLTYVMAYGFVLILWGPLTHMLVVPVAIRLRRTARHPIARTVAKQASKINLTVFFALVVVLGTAPISPMLFDVTGFVGADGSPDVSAAIECDVDDELVACLVETGDGVDHVVALSGGEEIDRADGPSPFALEFHSTEAEEVVGQKQVTVELRDGEGETLRRYVQTVPAG